MSERFRLVVAGTRTITDGDVVIDAIERSQFPFPDAQIVTGGAPGVDTIARDHANDTPGASSIVFTADWQTYGDRAGPIRNREMAAYGDGLVAVWDGASRGTRSMINAALDAPIPVEVTLVDPPTLADFGGGADA